jgi:hypothetical protein
VGFSGRTVASNHDAGSGKAFGSGSTPPSGPTSGLRPGRSQPLIDSQSVKTTEAGGPKGYDGGKKIAGRKRHVFVDTLGLIWGLVVLPAAPTDWDGAVKVFERIGKSLTERMGGFSHGAARALPYGVTALPR